MPENKVEKILDESKVIAVVGLSDKPERASHHVAEYLQEQGYKIVPVNPRVQEVLGEKAYASLKDIPFAVDIVDIFRRSEAVPAIVDDAIEIKAKTVWMQEGIEDLEAAKKAQEAGLQVVMNRCLLKEKQKRG